MKWSIIFALFLSLLPSASLYAQTEGHYYDKATLIEAQQSNQKLMQKMLDIGIKPYLSAEEKTKLAKVKLEIRLDSDLPETPEREVDSPFAAYAFARTNTIIIPALTLKFLEDLNLAHAWLYVHKCSLETPFEYVSMLKYHRIEEFPNGRYPLPLDALQIPKDALNDPKVDELKWSLSNEARAFILAHELGHIYYQHKGNPPYTSAAESQREETEADRFAVDVLSRSGTIPMGVFNLFMGMAHYAKNRWDFATDREWETDVKKSSHPLSPQRIYTLATTMEDNLDTIARFQPDDKFASNARDTVRSIIDDMVTIARNLEDKELQLAIKLSAPSSTHPQDLAPRCHQPVATTSFDLAFDDSYAVQWTYYYTNKKTSDLFPMQVTLQRTKDRVVGDFNFGLGMGHLSGIVNETTLRFTWEWGEKSGHGMLSTSDNGDTITGRWGWGQSEDDWGVWSGTRISSVSE